MSSKFLAFTNYNHSFSKINSLTYEHNKKYFDKYNIEYLSFQNEVKDWFGPECIDATQYHCYIKFLLLDKLMKERNDIEYIYAMDTDIVICDFNIDIRIFTKLSPKPLLACAIFDCDPEMYWNVNAGSLIFQNSDTGRSLIDHYLSHAKEHNFQINDQVLLQHILQNDSDFRSMVGIFPKSAFNHGDVSSFLYHNCEVSTSNQALEKCVFLKYHNLKNAIESLNIS